MVPWDGALHDYYATLVPEDALSLEADGKLHRWDAKSLNSDEKLHEPDEKLPRRDG